MLTELWWIRKEATHMCITKKKERARLQRYAWLLFSAVTTAPVCHSHAILYWKIPIKCISFHPVEFSLPSLRCWTQFIRKNLFQSHCSGFQHTIFLGQNSSQKYNYKQKFSTRVTLIAFIRNEFNLYTCRWPFLVQHCAVRCAYLCMVEIPMEKPSQLLRIKVPFILLHHIGRERKKSEDYSTSIVNVCFARAARTHDENDN